MNDGSKCYTQNHIYIINKLLTEYNIVDDNGEFHHMGNDSYINLWFKQLDRKEKLKRILK